MFLIKYTDTKNAKTKKDVTVLFKKRFRKKDGVYRVPKGISLQNKCWGADRIKIVFIDNRVPINITQETINRDKIIINENRSVKSQITKIKPTNYPALTKKKTRERIIPLNLFQTWNSLKLPLHMQKNVELLKSQNPEFKHHLYDDTMCRDFIKQHFDQEVLYTFDRICPGAYKADLWRYCVLYIHGGVYLDIKYRCINGFKLVELTDREYWVRDRFHYNILGIYQALITSKPRNSILKKDN